MVKGKLALAAGLVSFVLTAAVAADIPRTNPDDFRGNPALPSPDDLVRFDDSTPAPPANLDALGAIQGAFPVYYGAIPATVTPAERAAPIRTLASAPMRTPDTATRQPAAQTQPTAPAADPYADTQLALADNRTSSISDEVNQRRATPAQPVTQPASPAAPKTADAGPPPAQPARSADDDTIDLPEFRSDPAPDSTPLPPPLPELRAPATPALATAPVDITAVRADFNRLKTLCDEDSLGSAADVYAKMPDFGADEEVNRLRADAANLLILGLSRTDNLSAARRIYETVPAIMPGHDATLAKARGVINLATYYVRAERYTDAYDVLMDIGKIQNRSALNNELFRLMARMIPYLDNADQTDKATAVFNLLLAEVNSPGTAALFAENIPGVFKYYLHYVDKSESPRNRRIRLDFLEHAFAAMEKYADNPDIRLARKTLGESVAARYAGDPERASRFYVED